jgi:cell shape-determining protein MreD
MKYIIYVVIIGAIIGVTFGLFSSWGWNGFVPDLILLMVIALSLVFEDLDYLFAAIIGGFWLDVVYGLPIGSFTIPLVICGAVSSLLLRKWLFSEVQWYHFIGAIIGATFLLKLWIWMYSNILANFHWASLGVSGAQILKNLAWSVIANVILAYPVYVIVEMFARSQLRWQKNKIKL